MATSGLIFPQGPVIIVDKRWRNSPSSPGEQSTFSMFTHDDKLKVQTFAADSAGYDSPARGQKSPSTKHHQFRFVQSSPKTRGNTARPVRGGCRHKKGQLVIEKRKSVAEEQHHVRLGGCNCSESSTALYGQGLETKDVRYLELLKYCTSLLSAGFYPLQTKVKFRSNILGSKWLPIALHDEALINTIMLSTALEVATTNPAAYEPVVQKLSRTAIEVVNQRLGAKVLTDATIGAISCLILIALYQGHSTQATIHQSGLLETIRLRGGINSIEYPLQMKIYRAALLPTIDSLQIPRFPRLRPTRQPLHEFLAVDPDDDSTYTTLLAERGLHLDIIDIFLAMRKLSRALSHAIYSAETLDERSFDEDTMIIMHDLLSGLDTPSDGLNLSCRYTAIVYMNTLIRENPFSKSVCKNLSKALFSTLERDLCNTQDLYVWMVFMGAMASSATQERLAFRSLLHGIFYNMATVDWHNCQQRLERICWIADVHNDVGQKIWSEELEKGHR